MKDLVHIDFDSLSHIDKMQAIQKVVSEIEIKILVNSELGNDDVMAEYSLDLKELNLLYLDVMAAQDELDAHCKAFESFLDSHLVA